MSITMQIVCVLALVVTIFAWFLGIMEFLVNLYIHRDNQLCGKKDEESDFINTREMMENHAQTSVRHSRSGSGNR